MDNSEDNVYPRFAIIWLAVYKELLTCIVPILTISHVPNLPPYDPNLTVGQNVPKIEQCHKNGPGGI